MAISSTLTKNTWPGNGVATLWPFHFRINSPDHLAVILADPSGAETELDPSLYTVTGAGEDEGSVAYPLTGDPLAAGWSITLARRTPRKQETDLNNQGGLYLKAIERTLDGLTMMAQEQQEELARAAKMPISSPESADELIASVRDSASAAATSAGVATNAAQTAAADVSGLLDGKVAAADAAKTAAEVARDQVLALYDDFDDRYLGVKSVDPATDNDGNPLFPGALYFQQTEPDGPGAMKVYTGVAWVAAYVSGDSVLTVSNLLALLATLDASEQAAARESLGVADDAEPIGFRKRYLPESGPLPTGYLALDGSGFLVAAYSEFAGLMYCGDADNATAAAWYRYNDLMDPDGSRSTTGAYMRTADETATSPVFLGYGPNLLADGAMISADYVGNNLQPDRLLDNNSRTEWMSNRAYGTLTYDHGPGNPQSIAKYTLSFFTTTYLTSYSYSPTIWTLQGSNDSTTWADLDSRTGQAWAANGAKTYYPADTTAYRYHRLSVSASGTYVGFGGWSAYSAYSVEASTEPGVPCVKAAAANAAAAAGVDVMALIADLTARVAALEGSS
ncbi:hypothetical protein KL86APRO_30202 [uncultured Alphaproteobacteria bacterium]|uniref:F5/8 type C domain-containing protein n=1 Tax=uncultured Alphaproteobacteria bacterium TaxID=91750 RepID=A0A212KM09_9PROT|nr:hypothetical protein KL86APRO_30202 [uncultured Alphaproteobacteria bacterium]